MSTMTDTDTKRTKLKDLDTACSDLAHYLNARVRDLPFGSKAGVVHVATSATEPSPPAPAWYDLNTYDIFIHLDAAKIKSIREPDGLVDKDMAVVMGLLFHEAAHSEWSTWRPEYYAANPGIDSRVWAVMTLFEEMRVEMRAVATYNSVRSSIRAALPLAIGDGATDITTRHQAAQLWALGFGRALTSVVEPGEVSWVDEAARTVLGDDDIDYLTDILQEAIQASSPVEIEKLAREWLDVVGWPDHIDEHDCGRGHAGKPGDDAESDDDDGVSYDMGSFGSVDPDEVDDTEKSGALDPDAGKFVLDALERVIDEVAGAWSKRPDVTLADPTRMASSVFGRKLSKSFVETAPSARLMGKVSEASRVLENMSIPAITKTSVARSVPPGRLIAREAVRGSAERAQGQMATATPWRGTKRTHTATRPIVVGIATDVSGSMHWAQNIVAELAFIWTNAGHRVGARTAAVTFGDRVDAVCKPGEVLGKVRTRPSDGGTEVADKALAALDGALKLSAMNGAAKVLVVVSDGYLVITNEDARVRARLEEFKRAGVHVLWVTPGSGPLLNQLSKAGLATVVRVEPHRERDASAGLAMVHDAIVKALRQAV